MAPNTVVGYKILEMIHFGAHPYTRASLREEVARRFGAEVVFLTPDDPATQFDQLLEQYMDQELITEENGFLVTRLAGEPPEE